MVRALGQRHRTGVHGARFHGVRFRFRRAGVRERARARIGDDARGRSRGRLTADRLPGVLGLADTGGIDTTPYLLGGTLCLGLGAGFVTFSVHRSRA